MSMANRIKNWITKISPFRNSPRNHVIDTITIHCVVGQMSAESLCSHFQTANCSCNWAIGFDGRVAEIVPEGDRGFRVVEWRIQKDWEPAGNEGNLWDGSF